MKITLSGRTYTVKHTRTFTRPDGTRLAEFGGADDQGRVWTGHLCIKLEPGMTIAQARREAARRMEASDRRVTKLLGF